MPYKGEIQVQWAPTQWYSPHNVAFATHAEAQAYADWMLIHFEVVTRVRVIETRNKVTHAWRCGDMLYVGDGVDLNRYAGADLSADLSERR